MNLSWRLILCGLIFSVGVLIQDALHRHLEEGKEGVFARPQGALADLPTILLEAGPTERRWEGSDHPGLEEVRKQVPFADEVFYRTYQSRERNLLALVYAAYSRSGEDRKHHPEICMREALGAPEDVTARLQIPLEERGERLVQRFRFRTGTGQYTSLYYWHYTFPGIPQEGESQLQRLHRRLIASPPSITVQVTTLHDGTDLQALEATYLPALDAAFRAGVLPPGTVIGCDRVPITMIRR